jgi:hypothetical protein
MPLETRAKVAAERLLLMTEALADAVLNDRTDEFQGLLTSRQAVLDQLGTMSLDAPSMAILASVATAERNLISLIQRTQGAATQDLAKLFSGMRQVRAYRNAPSTSGMQRTG